MVQTFVIRVFVSDEPSDALRGVVQHIASGRERPFGRVEDLLSYIRADLDEANATSVRTEG